MGWSIGVNINTLRMDQEVADRLIDSADNNGHCISYDPDEGISFDQDAMEHMDFLWQEWAQEILDHPSVNGDVVFGSLEGDNKGSNWGYRFKAGKVTTLKAKVVIDEE